MEQWRAFAREGTRVFLAGRTGENLDKVAEEIRSSGGRAETAVVAALEEARFDGSGLESRTLELKGISGPVTARVMHRS